MGKVMPKVLAQTGGAGLGDDTLDDRAQLSVRHMCREIALDDRELLLLFGRKLGPVALAERLDRVARPLRLLLEHLLDRDIVKIGGTMLGDVRLTRRLVFALRAEALDRRLKTIDALALDRGQHETQRVTAKRVARLHGGPKIALEPFVQRGCDAWALRPNACAAWLPCACGVLRGARRTRGGGLQRGSQPAGSSC